MNGRPEGPSPALIAAQRRLEEARRSHQLSAVGCQPRAYQPRAASGERRADRGQWPAITEQASYSETESQSFAQLSAVKLHPSIALAMLGQGLAAPGRIWLLLRYVDQDGRGWLDLGQVQRLLSQKESELRVCGRRQLRNLLRQGEGIYWRRDKSRLWLRSAARVAIALEVERLRGRPVAVPLKALLGGMGQVRAHFYASFHSGRSLHSGRPASKDDNAGSPINRTTLRQITHVPARTQRLYEQRAGVEVWSNMAVGEKLTDKNLQERAWRHGRATFLFTDAEGRHGPDGGRYVAWRLPNSYQGPHALSPKGRTKKINHQIDLVNSRAQGNDLDRTLTCEQVAVRLKLDRLFHTNGREAGRVYNRDQSKDQYWPASNARAGGRRLWRVLPAREER